MKNIVLCVTGMPGSGKSVLSDYFAKKGFQFLRFGQITLDEVKKRKLAVNETNERTVREEIRKKHGMAAFAILNYPKIVKLLKTGSVVADGLYSWAEYKYLKENLGNKMIVVAIYAPPELRHKRISARVMHPGDTDLRNRPISASDAELRDFAEIEKLDKGGPIAMADYTLINTETMTHFNKQISALYSKIKVI